MELQQRTAQKMELQIELLFWLQIWSCSKQQLNLQLLSIWSCCSKTTAHDGAANLELQICCLLRLSSVSSNAFCCACQASKFGAPNFATDTCGHAY